MGKVVVIGDDSTGKKVAGALRSHDVRVVSIEDVDTLDIHGIKYQERRKPRHSKALSKLMVMASMFGGLPDMKESEHPDVNIISEFALIQKKKSNLSRSQREWVEAQFHSKFKQI